MIFISHLFSFISTPRVKEDFYINTSIVTICLIWPRLCTITPALGVMKFTILVDPSPFITQIYLIFLINE